MFNTNKVEATQIAKALYVVNKYTKKIRDARNILKDKLFRSITPQITEEMKSFLEFSRVLWTY